jgi:hypothetical protein
VDAQGLSSFEKLQQAMEKSITPATGRPTPGRILIELTKEERSELYVPLCKLPPTVWNFLASQASSSLVFSQPRKLPHKTSVVSNEG